MQAREAHEQGRARTRMTKDKKFLAREELPDLRNFFARDSGTVSAFFLLRLAFEQNACGGFDARQHSY